MMTAAPPPDNRRPAIDLMRILAALGIVWAHMAAPYMAVGYVALAAFVALTAVLSSRSLRSGGAESFLRSRARRILLPWALASLAYLAIGLMQHGRLRLIPGMDDWRSLLIGPAIHLWFLPFLFLITPLVMLAVSALQGRRRIWLAAILAAPLALAAIWLHDRALPPAPFAQWVFAVTPLCYGLIAAAAGRQGPAAAPFAFAVLATMPAVLGWGSILGAHLLAGALIFESFWRAEIDFGPRARRLLAEAGSLAFGVYLVHPFVMLLWFRAAGQGAPRALGALTVFALSALGVHAARRILQKPLSFAAPKRI